MSKNEPRQAIHHRQIQDQRLAFLSQDPYQSSLTSRTLKSHASSADLRKRPSIKDLRSQQLQRSNEEGQIGSERGQERIQMGNQDRRSGHPSTSHPPSSHPNLTSMSNKMTQKRSMINLRSTTPNDSRSNPTIPHTHPQTTAPQTGPKLGRTLRNAVSTRDVAGHFRRGRGGHERHPGSGIKEGPKVKVPEYDSNDEDDDEQEGGGGGYGHVIRHWNVGESARGNAIQDDEQGFVSKWESMEKQLEGVHVRFLKPAPIHALLPPSQIEPSIQPLNDALHHYSRTLANLTPAIAPTGSTIDGLDADGLIPKIIFATDHLSRFLDVPEQQAMRPDALVFPRTLLQGERANKYERWATDQVVAYGESGRLHGVQGEERTALFPDWIKTVNESSSAPNTLPWSKLAKLPDIFSRAHQACSTSGHRRIVITLLQTPDKSIPTQVFVSPSPSIDLEGLGQAAVEFREKLDHLLEPFRLRDELGNSFGPKWLKPVVVDDHHQSDTKPEYDQDQAGKNDLDEAFKEGLSVPLFDENTMSDTPFPNLHVPRAKYPGETITSDQLDLLISTLSRSFLAPLNPLSPGVHDRFKDYGTVFHTYGRGWFGLWAEDEEGSDSHKNKRSFRDDSEAPKDEGVDLAQDLHLVTSYTAGLGLSFMFELDPSTFTVSCKIHTSFHFWKLHIRHLYRLASLLFYAIRPSFMMIELLKKGVKDAGWVLPHRSSAMTLAHLSRTTAAMQNLNFGGKAEFNHCRLVGVRPEAVWKNFPDLQVRRIEQGLLDDYHRRVWYTRLMNRNEGDQNHRGQKTNEAESNSTTDSPATPSPAPRTSGLRPLFLSPSPKRSAILDPMSTPAGREPENETRIFSGASEVTKLVGGLPGGFKGRLPLRRLPSSQMLSKPVSELQNLDTLTGGGPPPRMFSSGRIFDSAVR